MAQFTCEHCGNEINLGKAFLRRHGKTHKIVTCPTCLKKNFVPIIQRFTEKD